MRLGVSTFVYILPGARCSNNGKQCAVVGVYSVCLCLPSTVSVYMFTQYSVCVYVYPVQHLCICLPSPYTCGCRARHEQRRRQRHPVTAISHGCWAGVSVRPADVCSDRWRELLASTSATSQHDVTGAPALHSDAALVTLLRQHPSTPRVTCTVGKNHPGNKSSVLPVRDMRTPGTRRRRLHSSTALL